MNTRVILYCITVFFHSGCVQVFQTYHFHSHSQEQIVYFGREVLTDIPAVEETVAVSNFELPSYVYLLASARFAGVLYHLVLIPKLIHIWVWSLPATVIKT